MLEGVLKECSKKSRARVSPCVSILGMLEGVLKAPPPLSRRRHPCCFNPWYVGGGVKRP